MRSKYKVSDVLTLEKEHLQNISTNKWQYRTLEAIRKCRTIELGGHIDKCNNCNKLHISYNSCRNRHCPTCQGHKREEWIQARSSELLPVTYFHVVFTLPKELNKLFLFKPKEMYSILFKSSWETLKQFGENEKLLGARIGMIGVLHTWGQNLSLHPHLHCIVPGGGVSKAGYWKNAKNNGKFLFNVKSMSKVFRAKFVSEMRKSIPRQAQVLYDKLFSKNWVVYAKRPFGNPKNIVEYLGRYSHKIAISNFRILNIDKEKHLVTFSLKDYRKGGQKTQLTLNSKEFIRRFCLHILPKGFTRIRHYGILSSGWKKEKLPKLQEKMGVKIVEKKEKTITLLKKCPSCKKGELEIIISFDKRGPPKDYLLTIKKLLEYTNY